MSCSLEKANGCGSYYSSIDHRSLNADQSRTNRDQPEPGVAGVPAESRKVQKMEKEKEKRERLVRKNSCRAFVTVNILRPFTSRTRCSAIIPLFLSIFHLHPHNPPPPWVSRCAPQKTPSSVIKTIARPSLSPSHPIPDLLERGSGHSSPPPLSSPSSSSLPTSPSSTGHRIGLD